MKKINYSFVLFGILLWNVSCGPKPAFECLPATSNELKQAIVWLPESEDSNSAIIKKLGADTLTLTASCPCNKSLQLWGKDTPIYGTIGESDDHRKPRGGSGSSIDLYGTEISPNYRIYDPSTPAIPIISPNDKTSFLPSPVLGQPILIGVLDSGLKRDKGLSDIPLWKNQYENPDRNDDQDRNGLKGDVDGWDFTELTETGGSGWQIDESNHGTAVTAFIADELRQFKYQIMPLKVLGQDKNGHLFNAICAMEYARQQMVKQSSGKIKDIVKYPAFPKKEASAQLMDKNKVRGILNLSWGYYDLQSPILKTMLDKLRADGILVVAAAGNQGGNACDDADTTTTKRNLSTRKRKFFPAAYELDNLIVATTVDWQSGENKSATDWSNSIVSLRYAENQNYSNRYVDVGVLGDRSYFFNLPYLPSSEVWGSSIAAPIATAQIAKAVTAGQNSKTDIFNWLKSPPNRYVLTSTELQPYIKEGKYTKRKIKP